MILWWTVNYSSQLKSCDSSHESQYGELVNCNSHSVMMVCVVSRLECCAMILGNGVVQTVIHEVMPLCKCAID